MTGSSPITVVETGFVSRHPLPAAPRVALAPDGRLVCAFVGRSGAGTSDYGFQLAESVDEGHTWADLGPLWPEDTTAGWSISGSISRAPDGDLVLYGTQTPPQPGGASWWDPVRGAIADNTLFWSRSRDGGRTWSSRQVIPMPIPGSAEAPGPMLITRSGRWLACYAPYPTFDVSLVVDRPQIVVVRSDDAGATWQGATMLRLHPDGGTAEAWLVELADGRLFGSCWGMDLRTGLDVPNPYAVSADGGVTWSPTRSTGLPGQAVGMVALPDGRVAMVYNQRDAARDPVGVWMALLRPTADDPGVEADVPVWSAAAAAAGPATAAAAAGPASAALAVSGSGEEIGHDAWQHFMFGEPGVALLPDGDLLVTIWSGVTGAEGVVFVRVRLG